jgi:hypothetical protein
MKDLFKEDSNYKTIVNLSLFSVTTLLMIFPATASFVSNNQYHTVYAASSSSSSSKAGGSSTSNSTSPIGSSTFLKVITKVDNSKGGTAKPSDFTIMVSGKSPSPKSFPGSSSGTSVTLKTGKYKVTGSGPTGYTTSYSSGCSGTASGGAPIKCTISSSFLTPSPGGSNSTSAKTKPNIEMGKLLITTVLRANCSWVHPCGSNFKVDGSITLRGFGSDIGLSPESRAREGTAHYSFENYAGRTYSMSVSDGIHTWVYGFDGVYFQGPCQPPPKEVGAYCQGTLTPGDQSVVVNIYYKCKDITC